ncbi:transposase [Pontibacter sp. G13]|uniref:transposase n=1 Tax=Pontibacter sp. G13 TaxID=3074898 RepID=UPI00288BEB09|nr:transposase [Pontibacter sp. G13]WNJ18152.1 transposase [Pontibacter sp. G13]
MANSRGRYDRTFKLKTVEMSYTCDNIVVLARDLGLRPELIYRWRSEFSKQGMEQSFPGAGRKAMSPEEAEISQLKRELAIRDEELAILKKAIGIFSRRNGRSMNS